MSKIQERTPHEMYGNALPGDCRREEWEVCCADWARELTCREAEVEARRERLRASCIPLWIPIAAFAVNGIFWFGCGVAVGALLW